jgi:hypothetical protein
MFVVAENERTDIAVKKMETKHHKRKVPTPCLSDVLGCHLYWWYYCGVVNCRWWRSASPARGIPKEKSHERQLDHQLEHCVRISHRKRHQPAANYAIHPILSDISRPATLIGRIVFMFSTHSLTSWVLLLSLIRSSALGRIMTPRTAWLPHTRWMIMDAMHIPPKIRIGSVVTVLDRGTDSKLRNLDINCDLKL